MSKFNLSILFVFISLLVVACGGSQPSPVASSSEINIEIETNPRPMMMGNGEVILTIKDSNGSPIEGATVDLTLEHLGHNMGSMTGTATEQGNGRYAINAGFSMSGTWKLTVTVTKDGSSYIKEIEIPVQ